MVVNGPQVDLSYNSGTIRPIKRINLSDKIFLKLLNCTNCAVTMFWLTGAV